MSSVQRRGVFYALLRHLYESSRHRERQWKKLKQDGGQIVTRFIAKTIVFANSLGVAQDTRLKHVQGN